MYQIVHAAAGILIGSQTGNPWLAFALGLLSHFILDAIPHDSIESRDWKDKGQFMQKFALEAILDLWLFVLLVLILQQNNLLTLNWPIVAGIIGSLLPDYIWGVGELFKIRNPWLEKYKQFHEWVHTIIHQEIYLPLKYAVPIQIIIFVMFIGIYIALR